MCGRTACTLAPDEVLRACQYQDKTGKRRKPTWMDAPTGHKYYPSHNMAPTKHTPVIACVSKLPNECRDESVSDRVVTPMKWGLTPPWHKGDPYKIQYETNNCRVEGMLEKNTYRVPLRRGNRCVVLADGFFEWKTDKTGKQPYYFHFPQSDIKEEKTAKCYNKIKKEIKTENKPVIKDEVIKQEEETGIKKEVNLNPKQNSNSENLKSELPKAETNISSNSSSVNISTISKDNLENIDDTQDDSIGKCLLNTKNEDIEEWTGKRLLTIAGVFDIWKESTTASPLLSYSIITVPASKDMDWCHHRMPAILSNEQEVEDWLNSDNIPLEKAVELIKPKVCLNSYPVSKCVNNSRNNTSDCVKPVDLKNPVRSASSVMLMNWLQKAPPAKKQKT